jgi:hypothetical protein
VVIGDRLYTLPIHVEGRDEAEAHANPMEVDDGNNDAEGSGGQKQHETSDSPNNSMQEKEQGREKFTQDKYPDRGNQPNDLEAQGVIVEELNGSAATNLLIKSDFPYFNSPTGNCDSNLSQLTSTLNGADCHVNEIANLKLLLANPSGHASAQEQKAIGCELEGLIGVTKMPTKRSKRRGDSIDEQISDRAKRLKAKRNLDALGMPLSKSFLSFSDSCINSRIDKLRVSFGSNVKQGVRNFKRLEADILT